MLLSDDQKNEIISFTAEMVRIPGGSGNEAETAECVCRKMEELGYDEVLVDEYGSVLGILNGREPGPTLLFDGHMDVVPVLDKDKWDQDPYGAVIHDGRIWGRGTADMKGALAAMICAPAYLKRTQFSGTIVVSASVAEEILIGKALDHILNRFPVDAVVIGEPTGLKLGRAEKGRSSVEIICSGTVAHSSRPDLGDNAVYRMLDAVDRIRNIPRRSDFVLGDEIIELVEISSLPSPGSGSIPGSCRSLWECRLLPGETKEEFLERWKTALDGIARTDLRIAHHELRSYTGKTMKMEDFLPGWSTEDVESGFTSLVADSIRECAGEVEYYAAPYGCNALVSAAVKNIPTVILGPGDIASAHKPNESIAVGELTAAARIYGTICQNISRKSAAV